MKRVISDHKQGKFTNDFKQNISSAYIDHQNPEKALIDVITTLSNSVIDDFPSRELSGKEKKRAEKPWMTRGLIKSSKERKRLYILSLSHLEKGI